jgi:hypothetical protein
VPAALREGRGAAPAVSPARSVVGALRDLVLAPPTDESAPLPGPERPGASSPAPALAVLCRAQDARAVAVGAGSLLARRVRCGCALACVWTPAAASPRADGRRCASRQARRMAQALDGRGLAADACGRAAAVTLPASPEDAVAAARRALAAAAQVPTVLVLGGPRDGAFDSLLAEHDLMLALTRPGESDAVAALAVAGLAMLNVHATARPLDLRPLARSVAGSGLAVPSALRRALDGPLRELG